MIVGRLQREDGTYVNLVDEVYGAKANAATMPAGGVGIVGWLSAIWLALSAGITRAGRTTAIAGKVTVVAAATPVSPGSHPCGEGVTFVASTANTGAIYVYPAAGAKTDVVPLYAGDSLFWPVANTSALLVDASVSGESVYWMGAV